MNRVAVACSGGRDSIALLHATLKAAAEQGVEVLALHVHHGLSPNADEWQALVERQCARWAKRGWPVRFVARRLLTHPQKGDSVEAWARQARYRALREMAVEHGASLVLLAHHRRDQAETFLLQALRSAGVAGLSGMPVRADRDGVTWMRPWLHVPRERIEAYVRRHRLAHVDDDSNADTRFARNRMRHGVWTALTEAFPQSEAALADAAEWAQQATACLDELAAMDLQHLADDKGLDVRAWQALSTARRSNALRAWLRGRMGRAAGASLVSRLMDELATTRARTWPVESGVLRSYRGRLRFEPAPQRPTPLADRETLLSIRHTGVHALPGWGGRLLVEPVAEGGVPLAWLAHAQLKPRSGGERFQAGTGRPPRSLKKQYQAAAVPAWEREGPLVYSGGQLVFVPGLGIDARVIGLPGQPLVALRWLSP
ncbi:tRNA lysidine(34) synthetase TilS [Piscinibacter sp. XHJ-5]|uniref:tRNA lysidine(34) synthetase TilS n=1 Tax=Piscinibacter sp. XHJ-5 TaxID=3037797 RepID=UPI002452847F|nr:tRNA lysidine(34) synthetase TilS [Piscinibacter sp. XHJ-5]